MTDRFTTNIFRKLWIPAIVSSIGWALSDIADAVVVGQRMGSVGLAAVSLILPVYMINCALVHGFGIGGSVRYSQLLSDGRVEDAISSFNRVTQTALGVSVLTAVLGNAFMEELLWALGTVPTDGVLYGATKSYLRILVTATPLFYLSNLLNYYLRNDDNGKLAGIGSVVGNILDITLNVLFVLALGMGTAGAALSTAIGQVVAILIYLPGLFGKKHVLQVKKTAFAPGYAFSAFGEGFSGSVQYLFSLVFIMFSNNYLIRAGNETSVAVFDMLQNAAYLILYLYEGTIRATQPIASTYHGEHWEEGERSALRLSFIYGGTAGLLMALVIAVFAPQTCALFGLWDAEAIGTGVFALRLFCVGSVFAGISLLSAGYFQSCGRDRESFVVATLRGCVVLLPMTVAFALWDADMFWWLFPVTEALSLPTWMLYAKLHGRTKEQFDSSRIYHGSVRGKNEEIVAASVQAEAFCEMWRAEAKQVFYVTMTIEELCLAIVQNGFRGLNVRECYIKITIVAETDGMFTLHIRDNARFFNPFALSTNKASEKGGFDMDAMGMSVVKQKAKDFFYRQYGGFNSLVVKI
ncbi:MAG: polysaccharide biosynthesis C-terminal domain-containing protein [Synergistaceae bacterium]|jgi:Na+-driven multidrug efflux pump|nr:polysaccharide biosynthesis C-terminal domain-containing protein [Synergistaceae bacterium]